MAWRYFYASQDLLSVDCLAYLRTSMACLGRELRHALLTGIKYTTVSLLSPSQNCLQHSHLQNGNSP